MIKRFCLEPPDKIYEVIREREKLYSLLRQTTDSRLKGHFSRWTINPVTRYPTTSFHFNQERIYQLYDTDAEEALLLPEKLGTVMLRKRSRRPGREEARETLFL